MCIIYYHGGDASSFYFVRLVQKTVGGSDQKNVVRIFLLLGHFLILLGKEGETPGHPQGRGAKARRPSWVIMSLVLLFFIF